MGMGKVNIKWPQSCALEEKQQLGSEIACGTVLEELICGGRGLLEGGEWHVIEDRPSLPGPPGAGSWRGGAKLPGASRELRPDGDWNLTSLI